MVAIFFSITAALAAGGDVLAQAWPQRPVRLIVPLPPGTAVDVSARVYAERLTAMWGQPVIVDNRPGADGIIAAREFVGRRDDHTLLYSFAGLITINPLTYTALPYDPTRDLVPIAASSDNCLAIAVASRLGVATLPELLKLARSRAEKINWAATAGLPNCGSVLPPTCVPSRPSRKWPPGLSPLASSRAQTRRPSSRWR
jgi:tripartite-type tricarboxylate transporter receptor subunit TctC